MYKQPKHTGFTIIILGAISLLSGGAVMADTLVVPDFQADTAATAQSVNDAFEAVEIEVTDNANDIAGLDSRISSFETDFSGYTTEFSAVGNPKNVVVLSQDLGNGNTRYRVRSRYQTTTEQISIDGVLTDRPLIANYPTVDVDQLGNIISIDNYIDAPDTTDYEVYHVEESTYDVAALPTWVKTVNVDGDIYRETFTCSGNNLLVCFATGRLSNGDVEYIYDWSQNRVVSGPLEGNGFTFNDVRLEAFNGTINRFRVRAKGIGVVLQRDRNSDGSISERSLIYYQANGTSGGSLAGTPFDTGQPLDGLFF